MTRELMMLYWALTAAVMTGLEISLGSVAAANVISSLVFVAVAGLIAWAYLYRKRTVRAYYAAVEKLSPTRDQSQPRNAA